MSGALLNAPLLVANITEVTDRVDALWLCLSQLSCFCISLFEKGGSMRM